MELCVKCFFDNKSDFDMVFNYLKPIVGDDIAYTGRDFDADILGEFCIETYRSITQAQLNELTALCPLRPRRKVSREAVYNRIAYLIGIFGARFELQ